jgi:ubiquinone/menaquinone biosynthesis C-methylase UbiE
MPHANKDKLRKSFWEKENYYEIAKKGSLGEDHPGMKILKQIVKSSKNILDLGCGEGTRLHLLVRKGAWGTGIDISRVAINIAKKRYPDLKFICGDINNLPFSKDSFDLVYSAFTLEHLDQPKECIKEAIRVTKKDGNLVLIAPNYGAPNRSSPPFKGSRLTKLIKGFIKDIYRSVDERSSFDWEFVEPIKDSNYEIDYDTTVEPYIGSLISFIKGSGMHIKYFSSCWDEELPTPSIIQRTFSFLGKINIYPFKYWGPHFVLVAKKI